MSMELTESNEMVYDVIILGGGTGGYVAAIRAVQLGLKVAIIEADKVGGTCLHRGCIPSKAYLRTAELFHSIKTAAAFGIEVQPPIIHWGKVMERKNMLVQTLHQGVQGLIKKHKIELIHGRGFLRSVEELSTGEQFTVTVNDTSVKGNSVILATGSRPMSLGVQLDAERIMTSDQALERATLPRSVIIIGGGTIGMEWASLYHDCGVEVTVIESQQRILLAEDEEIAKEAHRIFNKRGIRFHTETTVTLQGIERTASGVSVPIIQKDGTALQIEAEAILLSVGRQPNMEGIYAHIFEIGKKGAFIGVNEIQQTNLAGIYAIGDVCGGGLAHVAALQGTIAVEHIAGLSGKAYHSLHVPKCTYTRPEIASVGYTEEGARQAGYELKVGKFPLRAIGKALIYGEFDGFAKIITDSTDGKILGAHLIGTHATDLIAEPGVVLANELQLSQWLKSIHPHPALSEVFHEALLAVEQRAIHM